MKFIQKRKLDTNQISKVAYNRLQSTLNVISKSQVVHKDINNITSEELQEYFNTLTYYSNSYINKIIEQFSQAFKYAMNVDKIVDRNEKIHKKSQRDTK